MSHGSVNALTFVRLPLLVIPAKAGIHLAPGGSKIKMDPGFRRDDDNAEAA